MQCLLINPELFKFCWLVPTAPVAVVVNVENAPSKSKDPVDLLSNLKTDMQLIK